MKKKLLTALSALLLGMGSTHAQFLEKVCYRGAFAPAPTPMWTDGWTEWDPQNKTYPAANFTVSANITSNTTWSTGQTVLLQGPIYVTNNAVLTIQPGVVIYGSKAVAGSGLFITKGSKLNAVGNASNPIVFTSDQPTGSRDVGDWGGVILMGKASNNNPNGINNVEGIATSSLTEYGGGTSPDDNDNSGDLEYIRIEFGGYVYAPNKEINGLTFGAVGAGTKIDYIQCSFINDDAFEWFGGSVHCKHLIAYRCIDDDFDTDNGFHGMVQFGLGVRDPQLYDGTWNVSGGSTSEGFESDNDPNGTSTTPITTAIFSNITDIGPLRGSLSNTATINTTNSGFRRGARIRRNSSLRIINTILMDHATRGVYIDGAASERKATKADSLIFAYNIVAGYGQRATETGTYGILANPNQWIASKNDTLKSTTGILTNPYNYTSPDYRPAVGSIALTGADFSDAVISPNAGGSVSCNTSTTSINENSNVIGEVSLYPNPTSDLVALTVNTQQAGSLSIAIYDITGKVVATPVINDSLTSGENKFVINTTELNNGIYFVTLNSSNSKATVKLIVNK